MKVLKENNPKIFLIAYIVVVLVIGAIIITLFVGRCATRKVLEGSKANEAPSTECLDDEAILDLMNGDNAEIMDLNGSSEDLLNETAAFVNTYLNALSEGDYKKAYDMYAIGVVEKKGYTYTYEKFCENSGVFLEKEGIEKGESVLVAHYNGCIENENFVSVSLVIGRKLNGEYSNSVAAEYTLIKVNNEYKLLDFPYMDFDLYSYKFVENGGIGMPEIVTGEVVK